MSSTLSTAARPLVVVANRLPVGRAADGTWVPSAGGLVTAMRPVMEEVGGAWIGWDGGAAGVPRRVEGLNVDLHPVALSRAQVQGFYYGFSNRTIWPLFHDLIRTPVIDRRWWRTYQEVNRTFAEAAAGLDLAGEPPLFWIQDYHLMLLPEQVRALHPASPIGFFLHIPFPPPELFARLPWREEIVRGLLASDAVGFHTERYRDNFARSCHRLLRGVALEGDDVVLPEGRRVRTSAHPISIDTDEFSRLARDPETDRELEDLRAQFAGRHVFLGVDRLDYTKGIRHRLQAIEVLLDRNPDLRSRVAFVQIAVPSRDDVKEYRDLRTDVETEVGRINGRFTEPGGDVPVHYLYRGVSKTRLAAYYRLADVMCVTPLKDGMNLVAKEFVTCQDAGQQGGALLLSEFTGAMLEFADDCVPCNPFDVEGLSYRMQASLELEPADRRERIRRMAARVRDNDVFRWVRDELTAVEAGATGRGPAGELREDAS
jgi:trehalose 6-phosphate synthase